MEDSSLEAEKGVTTGEDLPIPPHLREKLEGFQQRLWSVKIAEASLAGLFGLGVSYLLVFLLDRFIDTPEALRAAVFLAGFAVPAIGLPLRWHRWVRKQRSLEQVARLLKRRYPRLGDELLGIVELASRPGVGSSSALVQAAMRQVDERVRDREFDDAVPANHYGAWLVSALSVSALAALLLFLVFPAAGNALARWVSPWKETPRYTFAQLEGVPEKVIVPYAERFDLDTRLAEETEWRPAKATVKLPGKTKIAAPREEDRYGFDVPPQKESGELGLRVGDEFRRISVDPLPRPELTDLHATLRLPDYLRYETDPVVPVRGGQLTVVEGARTSLTGKTSRALAEARADGVATRVEGDTFSTEPVEVTEPITRTLTWSDIHGLRAKSPLELDITPVEDEEPDIFARQLTTEKMILVDEVVSFDLTASDDFGIRTLGLEWFGQNAAPGSEPARGEKPVAAGEPEKREIETRATFSAEREGIAPQTLQVRAFAEDFLPDRERSYSPTFVLHILSPEDHADWLTREFGKWFRNAREVYEREKQLHETNRSLRALSSEDLDRPENRRQLREQASAESSNARRLDSLTDAGRDLVRQAAKNDEFDAERLESWATMMRSLDEIAEQRMPSVSDLLRESSRAEGGRSGSPSKPGEKSAGGGQSGSQSKPGEDAKSKPDPAGSGATSVGNRDSGAKPGSPGEKEETDKPGGPKAPSISDRESSLDPDDPEKKDEPGAPKKESPGALRLPSTVLGPAGDGSKEDAAGEEESPAQELLGKAIREQEELLEEFARVADQLQEILSSLEASTFVKRLKAASRKQGEIAASLNETLHSGFGLPRNRIEQRLRDLGDEAAAMEEEQSSVIYDIQSDLEAYHQRKQEAVFKSVLDQMRQLSVVSRVKEIGRETSVNLSGRSIAAAEFWADTLDRWAEELVSASECSNCQGGSKDSLPPEIVLEIMKALQEEMYLRDETREIQSSRPALAPDVFEERVRPLELTQAELRDRIDGIIGNIRELPDAERQFAKEVQLLSLVSDVMREARAVLARPDTGPEAIAAETEAIELLLQSKRQPPQGGGGGGSNPGGGGTANGSGAALTDVGAGGIGSGEATAPAAREVDQSTGKAGRELPEEFRRGLDTYFNALESN